MLDYTESFITLTKSCNEKIVCYCHTDIDKRLVLMIMYLTHRLAELDDTFTCPTCLCALQRSLQLQRLHWLTNAIHYSASEASMSIQSVRSLRQVQARFCVGAGAIGPNLALAPKYFGHRLTAVTQHTQC